MDIESFYNSLKAKKKKTDEDPSLISQLTRAPIKDKGDDIPHLSNNILKAGVFQEADLLYLPEDNLDNADIKYFWVSVKEDKVKPEERKLYNNIFRSFLDTDDKLVYIITDVVKPTKISKQKKGLYYKYYDKSKYGLTSPLDENDYEYTEVNLFLNAKWAKWKNRIKGIQMKPEININGYKYLLVVVDAYDSKCDAEPLKERTSRAISEAFEKIYQRGILQIPNVIQFDSGTEFKGETAELFKKDFKAGVKYALPNRHRQNSLVERKNREIGETILKFQAEKELDKKKTVKGWVKYLPSLITAINKHSELRKRRKLTGKVLYTNKSKDLIPLHSKVRRILDYPIDATGKRIGNVFRGGDIRWNKTPQTVEKIILEPDLPPLYQLNKIGSDNIDNRVAYTKSQLQFV
jgi:hypothetical protein